jgi:WD40 repeat protein
MPSIDPARVKVQRSISHAATLYAVAVDPSGPRLYAGSEDYSIYVHEIASPKEEPVGRWTKHDNYVSALACVVRGSKPLLVSGSYDRQLIWWDTATGNVLRTVAGHQGWVRDLVVCPDGSRFATCGDDMLVKVWETDTGKLVRSLEGHAKVTPQGHVTALYTVAVSPDGKYLASGDRIGTVIVWEAETGKVASRFEVPTLYTYDPRQRKRSIGGIRAVTFSRDGNLLAVGGIGQVGNVDGLAGPAHVEIWDWRRPRVRATLALGGHKGIVNHLEFASGEWLIGAGGGSDGGFLGFWKIDKLPDTPQKDGVPSHRIKTDGHVHRFALNAAGTELYAAGYKKLDIWGLGA